MELFRLLNVSRVRYLLIGGQAMRLHGMPRFSMDWDFFIPGRDLQNLECLNTLLENDLEVPVEPLGPKGENFLQTEQTRWGILQFHLLVPGLPSFDEAEAHSVKIHDEHGDPVNCLDLVYLLKSKEAANRPVDQQDIFFLKEKIKHLGL